MPPHHFENSRVQVANRNAAVTNQKGKQGIIPIPAHNRDNRWSIGPDGTAIDYDIRNKLVDAPVRG